MTMSPAQRQAAELANLYAHKFPLPNGQLTCVNQLIDWLRIHEEQRSAEGAKIQALKSQIPKDTNGNQMTPRQVHELGFAKSRAETATRELQVKFNALEKSAREKCESLERENAALKESWPLVAKNDEKQPVTQEKLDWMAKCVFETENDLQNATVLLHEKAKEYNAMMEENEVLRGQISANGIYDCTGTLVTQPRYDEAAQRMDEIINEKNVLVEEKKVAIDAKDAAIKTKDEAVEATNAALTTKNTALAEKQAAEKKCESLEGNVKILSEANSALVASEIRLNKTTNDLEAQRQKLKENNLNLRNQYTATLKDYLALQEKVQEIGNEKAALEEKVQNLTEANNFLVDDNARFEQAAIEADTQNELLKKKNLNLGNEYTATLGKCTTLEGVVQDLKNEKAAFGEQLQRLIGANTFLVDDNARFEKAAIDAETQHKILVENSQNLRNECTATLEKCTALEGELQEVKGGNIALEKQKVEADEQCTILKGHLESLKEVNARLIQRNKDFAKQGLLPPQEVLELKDRFEAIKKEKLELLEEVMELHDQMQESEQRVTESEEQLATAEEDMEELKKEKANLRSDVILKKKGIQEKDQQLKEQCSKSQSALSDNQEEISALNLKLKTAERKSEEQSAKGEAQNKQLQELGDKLRATEQKAKDESINSSGLQQRLDKAITTNNMLRTTNDELEKDNKDVNHKLAKILNVPTEVTADKQRLASTLQRDQSRLKEQDEHIASLESSRGDLEKEMKEAEKLSHDYKAKLESAQDYIRKAEKEAATMKEQHANCGTSQETLTKEARDLTKQLHKVTEECDYWEASFDKIFKEKMWALQVNENQAHLHKLEKEELQEEKESAKKDKERAEEEATALRNGAKELQEVSEGLWKDVKTYERAIETKDKAFETQVKVNKSLQSKLEEMLDRNRLNTSNKRVQASDLPSTKASRSVNVVPKGKGSAASSPNLPTIYEQLSDATTEVNEAVSPPSFDLGGYGFFYQWTQTATPPTAIVAQHGKGAAKIRNTMGRKTKWGLLLFLLMLLFLLVSLAVSQVRKNELLGRRDDLARMAMLSLRAGGGTGTAWPAWLWDDKLVELGGGFYE